MDFDITKVTIDGNVGDLSEDQLRELVSKFQDAQESNVAEFEKAIEATEEVDSSTIEDFEDARESLIEDITEAEAFDKVPLTEDSLEDTDFSELQEWRDFVAGQAAKDGGESDEADEGGEAEFGDMGTQSPTDLEDEQEDFVEETLSGIQGLNLD